MHRIIVQCKNVQELSLTLHDSHTIPSFTLFLKNMWIIVGPNLRKLTIDATWEKLPLLLDLTLTAPIKHLEDLNVRLIVGEHYSPIANPGPQAIEAAFVAFVQSQRHSLQSLTLSSFEHMDLSSIFDGLGHLSYLRELHLRIALNRHRLPLPSTLTCFLRAHKDTLQSLSLQPDFHWPYLLDVTYATWVNMEFSALKLPALLELKIGLWKPFHWTSVLPHAPRLTSLVVTDAVLIYDEIENMTKDLQRASASRSIKTLRLSILHVTWKLLDLLAATLPELGTLITGRNAATTLSIVSISPSCIINNYC
jgi:hypothetical protein